MFQVEFITKLVMFAYEIDMFITKFQIRVFFTFLSYTIKLRNKNLHKLNKQIQRLKRVDDLLDAIYV